MRVGAVAAGILTDAGNHTSFAFIRSYLNNPERPILGQIFEDTPTRVWSHKTRVAPWFANLLPEGDLRAFLASSLGVSGVRDAPLLGAIGADLPGAVTLERADSLLTVESEPADSSPTPHENDPTGVRFSVAGYQLKLSMVAREKSGWTLAGRGELGNSIVKLPSLGFPEVPLNEFVMMSWARELGMNVPDVELVNVDRLDLPGGFPNFGEPIAFAIRRFDRADDSPHRIHIEDMNQVIGNWPHEKYRNVSYESLGRLIAAITGSYEDLVEYVRRLVFMINIGNEDAHIKNWSLIYSDPRQPRLSPAYDLVSTIGYTGLARGLGLNLNRSKDFRSVSLESFRRLGRKIGLDEDVSGTVASTAVAQILDTAGAALAALPDRGSAIQAHMARIPLFADA